MSKHRRIFSWVSVSFLLLLFIPGCAGKPFLTKDDTYSIALQPPQGQIQTLPVKLGWNSNFAVLQELLLEASFVMSDLHTLESPTVNPTKVIPEVDSESTPKEPSLSQKTVMLQAHFPQSRKFTLTVNDKPINLDLESVEIEVEGSHPGRVILNQTLMLQGIQDPNLKPAFKELLKMLGYTEDLVPVKAFQSSGRSSSNPKQ